MGTALPDSTPPAVVLDTNVLLDWLVFGDPRVAALVRAIEAGDMVWVATTAMRDELAAVLSRAAGRRWSLAVDRVWQAWDRHAVVREARTTGGATPRCRDPDDQMFIDLAVAEGGKWLLTRDRAVLALAKRLRARGVQVATPERWAAVWPM